MMINLESINYSDFFNNRIIAHQVLFNHYLNSSSLNLYREDVAKYYSIDLNNLAVPEQIHSDTVRWIDKGGSYNDSDGLLTNHSEIVLSLQTADCLPVFIFDKINNTKGLIHSGWRGTKNKIVINAINIMLRNGSKKTDIFILIGASIQKCCYEIGDELTNYFDDDCIYKNNNKKFLSLQEQIMIDLRKINIPQKNIYIDSECTFTNNKLSSYRRDGSKAGRMISFIGCY